MALGLKAEDYKSVSDFDAELLEQIRSNEGYENNGGDDAFNLLFDDASDPHETVVVEPVDPKA